MDDNASPFSNFAKNGYPPEPFLFRWSDGPTMGGHLARLLEVDCDFANDTTAAGVRCDNYISLAEGGACSRTYDDMPSMTSYCTSGDVESSPFFPKQVENFKSLVSEVDGESDLFFISVGGNDVNGFLQSNDGWIDRIDGVLSAGDEIVEAIVNGIKALYDYGARHFLVANVPPVLITPRAIAELGDSGVLREVADEYLESFAERFRDELDELRKDPKYAMKLITVNLRGCLREKEAGRFDQSDLIMDEPCVVNRFEEDEEVCEEPEKYFFFDDIHPSTAGHREIADEIFRVIEDPKDDTLCMNTDCVGDSLFDSCFDEESTPSAGTSTSLSLALLLAIVGLF